MKHKSLIKYFSVAATLVVAFLFFAVTAPADASPTLGCTFHNNAGEVGLPEQGCAGVIGSIDFGTCHLVSPVTETVNKGVFAGTTFTYDIACDDGSGNAYHYSTTGNVSTPVTNDIYYTFDNTLHNPLDPILFRTIVEENGTGQDAYGFTDLTPGLYGIGARTTAQFSDSAPYVIPTFTSRSGSISFWFKPETDVPGSYNILDGSSVTNGDFVISFTNDAYGNETWSWGSYGSGYIAYPLPVLSWHHLAYVNDVSVGQQRFYIDGNLVDTLSYPANYTYGPVTPMKFGGVGVVDEFKTWIGALSAADVAVLATP